jgi:hypothetical protein
MATTTDISSDQLAFFDIKASLLVRHPFVKSFPTQTTTLEFFSRRRFFKRENFSHAYRQRSIINTTLSVDANADGLYADTSTF